MSNSIFIQPTDSEEITNIISSLNINKASGPFSIPNKILIFLKQDISKQLADLFNLSFSSGSFPSILKTAKVVQIRLLQLHVFFFYKKPVKGHSAESFLILL